MIKRISAEVDNKTFDLNDRLNDTVWCGNPKSPIDAKEYKVKIIAEDMAGNITVNKDNKLIVTSPEKLIYYLPKYWYDIREMYALCKAEDVEVDFLHWNIKRIQDEQFILTSSENRIKQWERFLKIPPVGGLNDRKQHILSTIQSSLKLNEKNLKLIMKTINNKGAIIKFENSTLIIESFSDTDKDFIKIVEKIIKPKLPAHLGLSIKKYYCAWIDLKTDYNGKSWENQKIDFRSWKDIRNYLPPKLLY